MAPLYRIEVNGRALTPDMGNFIQAVEYESAVDMADMFQITLDNPGVIDDTAPDWTGHRAFQPGNEASLYIGYASADRPTNFVGRCIWEKHMPEYPQSGVPQLVLKGYDLSRRMMDNTGPIISGDKRAKPAVKRPVEEADNQGQAFNNILHSEVVSYIADMYGMEKDIEKSKRRDNVIIKKGMKHFELVKGLANINGFDFWVDFDALRAKWVIHWKDMNRNQAPELILRYSSGDFSTLLEASPEYGLPGTISTATVSIFDGVNQRWVSAIEIEDIAGPDPIFRRGGGLEARNSAQRVPRSPVAKKGTGRKGKKPGKGAARAMAARSTAKDVINEALENATSFRIASGGVAIDVLPPGDRFKSPDDAARYLLRWFLARQDNFIKVSGVCVGIETLRARQVHRLLGLGPRLDGDYYFTRVRHVLSDSYTCEFVANRVIVS